MLIIDVNDNESIDRALKKYKRKFDRSGVMKEIRQRKHYAKPSIKRRNEMLKAVYKQKMYGENIWSSFLNTLRFSGILFTLR